ncbi:MAG: LptA/OstA family protein [Pseudomonadota bacterium]
MPDHGSWLPPRQLVFAGILALALAVPAGKAHAQLAIDIAADVMELREKEQKAIFTGKVDAVRGGVKLKADKLVVDYAEVKRQSGKKKNEIRFLVATGNVTIISGGQTIRSRRARMDVKANRAVITGNVIVLRGKTKLNGNKLVLNLTTGQSRMEGGRVGAKFGQ